MPLTAGTHFGPYEIVSPLGAGGMGEVYRAKDTRLHREVAIKVLPETFASDPDRRARFEREAQAVAALSHPNVLAIFDTGARDGRLYLVTELLDGETLRARLTGGALPVRKAIEIGVQIARGLAGAHDKGLVHRDLKPDNIFLLADGQVKILDFGLARQTTTNSGATATVAALTDPGAAMGTVGYMAPEQVRGQSVDARTDLFAFGAVLYEMLSGHRAFQRDTSAETMTAILKDDPPDIVGSRPDLSPALDRIIRHCLEKNPAERFQSARDVAFALDAFSGTNTSVGAVSGAAAVTGRPRRGLRLAAMVLLPLIALGAGVLFDRVIRPAAPAITFETKTWDSEWITNARFAPDGQTIVFSAAPSGNVPQLFVIRAGTVTSQPLGDPGTHLLSISSKGELAVLTGARLSAIGHRVYDGTLARMMMDGAPREWMRNVSEADWSPDGSTLAISRVDGAKYLLEYPIGHLLYQTNSGYVSDLRVSPDGTRVAFFDHQAFGDDRGSLKIVDASGTVKTLTGEYWGEEGLAWSPDGRSVYFSASGQGGEEFQPLVVNATGTPIVRQAVPSAGAMYVQDVAANGRLLIMRDDLRLSIRALIPGESAEREFAWLDFAFTGFLSRDGQQLLFGDESQSAGTNYAVALRDVRTGKVVRLGEGMSGALSPDGKWAPALIPSTGDVVFYPTGTGDPVKLARGPIADYHGVPQWLPDGSRVFFCGSEKAKPPRCYVQGMTAAAPTPVTTDGIAVAILAGDGRTALLSDVAGGYHVATLGGTSSIAAKGITPHDSPFAWTSDGRGVLVVAGSDIPAHIERVDPMTGARTPVKILGPPDRAGVTLVLPSQWIDDGRGYVYSYFREISKLFVASGVGR